MPELTAEEIGAVIDFLLSEFTTWVDDHESYAYLSNVQREYLKDRMDRIVAFQICFDSRRKLDEIPF